MTCETLHPYELIQDLNFEMVSENGFYVHQLKIEVRVWFDDAYGMQAEPIQYRFGITQWLPMGSSERMDRYIRSIVTDEYSDEVLETIRDADPVFASLPFDDPPVSQSEFQNMRL